MTETKKMVLRMDCGNGTDTAEFYEVPVDITDKELDDYAWEAAVQHAGSYGVYPLSDQPEDYDEDEEDGFGDSYSEDISGWWEEYDPNEHDGLRVGGDDHWTKY